MCRIWLKISIYVCIALFIACLDQKVHARINFFDDIAIDHAKKTLSIRMSYDVTFLVPSGVT